MTSLWLALESDREDFFRVIPAKAGIPVRLDKTLQVSPLYEFIEPASGWHAVQALLQYGLCLFFQVDNLLGSPPEFTLMQ